MSEHKNVYGEERMTTQELLEKHHFKDLDEVKLIIKMGFPGLLRRAWVPVYPSVDWVIRALSFSKLYLQTNSIDTIVKWANKKEKDDEQLYDR